MTPQRYFPYAGRSFDVTYSDELVFRNAYSPDGKLVTAGFLAGKMAGMKMTVPFWWKALPGDNYLISWQENDKSTVVHCDNFEAKTTQCFYTMMDGSFYVLTGLLIETSETVK